jgi:hypothetical protein
MLSATDAEHFSLSRSTPKVVLGRPQSYVGKHRGELSAFLQNVGMQFHSHMHMLIAISGFPLYGVRMQPEPVMNRISFTTIVLSLLILGGCVPSKQEFDTIATTVQGSAKARKLALSQCMKPWTPRQRREAAIIIDSSEKDAPKLVCSRIVEAVRSGRLEYADAVDIKRRRFTPKLVKILQGR